MALPRLSRWQEAFFSWTLFYDWCSRNTSHHRHPLENDCETWWRTTENVSHTLFSRSLENKSNEKTTTLYVKPTTPPHHPPCFFMGKEKQSLQFLFPYHCCVVLSYDVCYSVLSVIAFPPYRTATASNNLLFHAHSVSFILIGPPVLMDDVAHWNI